MPADFKDTLLSVNEKFLRRITLEVLQVNLGDMCNQRCLHCHVNASPQGDKRMSRLVMNDIVRFLSKQKGLMLDITGGCPELNPDFLYLIEHAKTYVKKITVRNNLTIFFEEGVKRLPEYYRDNKIKLICSMPCYTKDNVEKQRGEGVFDKSIEALRLLNGLGYAKENDLQLDLVYNPGGAFLPGNQADLEKDYKWFLLKRHGVVFDRLLTMINAPISRFEQYLKANGNFDEYMKLLMDNFNKDVTGNIMCRNLLSVGWDGILYDCDFNQALGLALRDTDNKIMEIGSLDPEDLNGKEILFENHCYCCTAGSGSSCGGSLAKT